MTRTSPLKLKKIRTEVQEVRSMLNPSDRMDAQIFESCIELLDQCYHAQRQIIAREYLIWQNLFIITQKTILICPEWMLAEKWAAIREKILGLDRQLREQATARDDYKYLDALFRASAIETKQGSIDAVSKVMRGLMKNLKTFLDDGTLKEILSGIILKRQAYILATGALFLLILLLVGIQWENGCLSDVFHCAFGQRDAHGVITMTLAGLLGGALSTLLNLPGSSTSAPALVRLALVRPVIGGIAGLVLYLIATRAGLLNFPYPSLYAAAVAVGFSEAPFSRALSRSAAGIESAINQRIGQSQ